MNAQSPAAATSLRQGVGGWSSLAEPSKVRLKVRDAQRIGRMTAAGSASTVTIPPRRGALVARTVVHFDSGLPVIARLRDHADMTNARPAVILLSAWRNVNTQVSDGRPRLLTQWDSCASNPCKDESQNDLQVQILPRSTPSARRTPTRSSNNNQQKGAVAV